MENAKWGLRAKPALGLAVRRGGCRRFRRGGRFEITPDEYLTPPFDHRLSIITIPSSRRSLDMSFRFIPGRMYRMPVVFGPGLGPRQGVEGRKFTSPDSHKTITR